MGEMEEELRAKALASMSVSAKPKNNRLTAKPSPDAKEEGELSSPSEGDDDDDEQEEEQEKPQVIPLNSPLLHHNLLIHPSLSRDSNSRSRVCFGSLTARNANLTCAHAFLIRSAHLRIIGTS